MTVARTFGLEKWYCDCVGADGSVAIGYWASLQWKGLALTWEQITVFPPEGAPRQRSALTGDAAPLVAGSLVRWDAPGIGVRYEAARTIQPLDELLLETEEGTVRWRVEAPAARVTLAQDGDVPFEGTGYVERLSMTVPPWALPLKELRWGRWISTDRSRSVVWIDWRGKAPKVWAYLDGQRLHEATVTDEGVRAPGVTLTLDPGRTLIAHALDEVVARIPPLRPLVPVSLLQLRQDTRLSVGRLSGEGASESVTGTAVHELVVLP